MPYVLYFTVLDQDLLISGEGSIWIFDPNVYWPFYEIYSPLLLLGSAILVMVPSLFFNRSLHSRLKGEDIRFLVIGAFFATILLQYLLVALSYVSLLFAPPLVTIAAGFSFFSRVAGVSFLVLVVFPAFHYTLPLTMKREGALTSPATRLWLAICMLPSAISYLDASLSSFIRRIFSFSGTAWWSSVMQTVDNDPLVTYTANSFYVGIGPSMTSLSVIPFGFLIIFSYYTLLHLRHLEGRKKAVFFGILYVLANLLLDVSSMIELLNIGYVS
ncbi:MAG: hypothetical protein ACFFD6_02495, partial [Candidatus Thorarchaeota archaeon]